MYAPLLMLYAVIDIHWPLPQQTTHAIIHQKKKQRMLFVLFILSYFLVILILVYILGYHIHHM